MIGEAGDLGHLLGVGPGEHGRGWGDGALAPLQIVVSLGYVEGDRGPVMMAARGGWLQGAYG